MTTRGRLDDVSLPDLLQTLSTSRRSGKLTLSHRNGYGTVLFRQGRMIYAASQRPREAFGAILASRQLVTEETLLAALEIQNSAVEERRLGSILREMDAVSEEDLYAVMKYQVCEVLRDLLSWKEGYFKFQPGSIPDRGEIGVDCHDLVLDDGLTAEGVLVDIVRRRWSGEALEDSGPETGSATPDGGARDATWEALSLPRVMAEVRSPAFTGEIALQILRFGAQVVRRGVLLAVGREVARGVGQFGVATEGATRPDEHVRQLRIPLDQPSIIAAAAATQDTARGALENTPWNVRLAEELGGVLPREAMAIPMTVDGRTAFVLYGDNLPAQEDLGDIEALEALMIEAGLVIEKETVERRLSEAEERNRDRAAAHSQGR